MNPQPGEVWLADLGLAAKARPVVIVSRHDPDPPRALVIYVPLTTQNRQSAYEVALQSCDFWTVTRLPMYRASARYRRRDSSADLAGCQMQLWTRSSVQSHLHWT